MSTYEKDAWDDFGDSGNGIEGQWLKCTKGHWLLDKESVRPVITGLFVWGCGTSCATRNDYSRPCSLTNGPAGAQRARRLHL
jgi:hypothetical protein